MTSSPTNRTAVVLCAAVTGLLIPAVVRGIDNPLGQPRPDAALVYIYAKGAMYVPDGKMHVYYDDHFAGVVESKTYTYIYVAPGTHLFWNDLGGMGLCDFGAGQTVYLQFDNEFMSILGEAAGRKLIAGATTWTTPSRQEQKKAAAKIQKTWPKHHLAWEAKFGAAGVKRISYSAPPSTEGLVKVPAGTFIAAELMETLTSGRTSTGDEVWVRAKDDVLISGAVFVRAGTPVKAVVRGVQDRGSDGKPGKIDVTAISIAAADGSICPVIGQIAALGNIGPEWIKSAAYLGFGIGGLLLTSALEKGGRGLAPAGIPVGVFTEQEVWINPNAPAPPTQPGTSGPGAIKAYTREPIAWNVGSGKATPVEIVFAGAANAVRVELTGALDSEMPAPIAAESVSAAVEGAVARFDRWALARFLRPGGGTQLSFRLTTAQGEVLRAQGSFPVHVK